MNSTRTRRALATVLTVVAFATTIPAAFGDEYSTSSTGAGGDQVSKTLDLEFTAVPTPIPLPSITLKIDGEEHKVGGQVDQSDTYRLLVTATKAAGSFVSLAYSACPAITGLDPELDGVVPGGVVIDVDATSSQTDLYVLLQRLPAGQTVWETIHEESKTLAQRSDNDSSPTVNACFG